MTKISTEFFKLYDPVTCSNASTHNGIDVKGNLIYEIATGQDSERPREVVG